jgi:hypothetical protein
MVQSGGGAGFLLKPIQTFRILGKLGRQDLDRDFTSEPRIPRPIDFTHPARTKGSDDLVRPKPGSG